MERTHRSAATVRREEPGLATLPAAMTATAQAAGEAGCRKREAAWWQPPLAEVLFAAVLLWLLVGGQARALLADGDTGWHIRTGDYVLANRRVPTTDPFSFSRPGEPWFAWEWASDVLLALAHRAAGLKGVAMLGGVLIAATLAALFQFLLWQRVHVVVAIVAAFVAGSASTVHWLARPHLFTWLLLVLSLWLLEADRSRPGARIWLLAPLGALWANLHAGFALLPAIMTIYLIGSVLAGCAAGRPWGLEAPIRYGGLLLAVSAATLLNPYGYRLHQHIWTYLGSDFIRDRVEEFQSPRFRGESMAAFEILLLGGLVAAGWLWKRREYAAALLVVALAHAALGSVRHVLLYVAVATPAVARLATDALASLRGEWGAAIASLSDDLAGPRRRRLWLPWLAMAAMGAAALALDSGRPRWRVEFPREKFPLAAIETAEEMLVGRRVLTSDQWGDYLIYRFSPRMRVWIDGRSDFYGPQIGRQYLEAMQAHHRWPEIVDRWNLDRALLPVDWPLATVLKSHPDWRLEYDDGQALLLRRVARSAVGSAN